MATMTIAAPLGGELRVEHDENIGADVILGYGFGIQVGKRAYYDVNSGVPAGDLSVLVLQPDGRLYLEDDTPVELPPELTTSYRDVVLSDSPKGYWRFEENAGATIAADETGNHPGTYESTGVVLQQLGAPGTGGFAMEQTGGHGGVDIPYSADLDAATFTYEAWIYPMQMTSSLEYGIVNTTDSGAGQTGCLFYLLADPGHTTGNLHARNEGLAYQTGTAPIALNQWWYVVVTYDGTVISFYVNGELSAAYGTPASPAFGGAFVVSGSGIRNIGNWGQGLDEFVGFIDEVAIYNYALSSEQVSKHMINASRASMMMLRRPMFWTAGEKAAIALPAPAVTDIFPTTAPRGGTTVRIDGTDFLPAGALTRYVEVLFGDQPAVWLKPATPTRIFAGAPPGKGVVDVVVRTLGGSSATGPQTQFTYSYV